MQHRIKPDVDVVRDVLVLTKEARPQDQFVQSLLLQYDERGGLSKKQLEGLYQKAAKAGAVPANKLATLEAIILKKPTRYKSALPAAEPLYKKDETVVILFKDILEKAPQHKRVLFLQAKYENNEPLTTIEISELKRFHKLLIK